MPLYCIKNKVAKKEENYEQWENCNRMVFYRINNSVYRNSCSAYTYSTHLLHKKIPAISKLFFDCYYNFTKNDLVERKND